MKEFAANKLVRIGKVVEHLDKVFLCYQAQPKKYSPEEKKLLESLLEGILQDLALLSLPMTKVHCERIIANIQNIPPSEMRQMSTNLGNLLFDEIKSKILYLVPPDNLKYYNNTELAGAEFKANFPQGNVELIEAGNCLAFDRYTSCVFHLMRALEHGLKSLEEALNIPSPEKGAERTWGKILERISLRITEYDKNPPPNWKRDRRFYQEVVAMLSTIKAPYRDATMHVESTYDEPGASTVFKVGVESLRHIATKLGENA